MARARASLHALGAARRSLCSEAVAEEVSEGADSRWRLARYKAGSEFLGSGALDELLRRGSYVFGKVQNAKDILERSECLVMSDRETGRPAAVTAFTNVRRPLLGSMMGSSETVQHVHRYFSIGVDDATRLELLKKHVDRDSKTPVVDSCFAPAADVGLLERAGFTRCGGVDALVCATGFSSVQPIFEKEMIFRRITDDSELNRLDAHLNTMSGGTRLAHWDLRRNMAFVLTDKKGEWLAACEASPGEDVYPDLSLSSRFALATRGSQTARRVGVGASSTLRVCRVGAIASFHEHRHVAHLFQKLNDHFQTDAAIHIAHEREMQLKFWREIDNTMELFGAGGLALAQTLDDRLGQVMIRTWNVNPIHNAAFQCQPISIDLETTF